MLGSTNITKDERKQYSKVLEKFDSHFQVRRNLIFERARFNKRDQREGESAEQYITALYQLAERCEYRDFKSEMIRDKLVVGIRNTALSEKLQMDAALTLEKAKRLIRQHEAVHEQQETLKDPTKDTSAVSEHNLDYVKNRTAGFQKGKGHKDRTQMNQNTGCQSKCTRCGKPKHARDKCPAHEAKCFKCQKIGHFNSQCRSKQVSAMTDHSEQMKEDPFLGAVTSNSLTQWNATIAVNNKQTQFKLDTGAEVTAISKSTHNTIGEPDLMRTSKALYGPAGTSLEVCGQFTASLSYKSVQSNHTVYVVKGLKNNLLGLPAIISLNLAMRIQQIEETSTQVQDEFPNIFKGLGTIGEEYEIRLKDGVKPRELCTARHVPIPLRTKVQEELNRMQSLGVISPVDEPTPWCAGMVVVPKPSRDIRICVDLKPLNEGVLREFHPLPKVEETLGQLNGATIFSKLDANSGFCKFRLPGNPSC